MKRLRRFAYHEPESLDEAIALLGAEEGARLLAGGTDLVVDMRTGRLRPGAVVNLKRIPGLDHIEGEVGGTRVGALTTAAAVSASAQLRRNHPALTQAAGVLGTPPVRAMATVGGNIGRASPASDLAPPLIVLGAVAAIEGRNGSRSEAVEDLYQGPGMTTLAPEEIVTSVFVPAPPPGFGSAHLKIGSRGGGTDIALVAVAAGVALRDGLMSDARIALSSVAPTPVRSTGAEEVLVGAAPTDEILEAAASVAAADCRPISDMRTTATHRLALVRVLVQRALRAALASVGAEEPS